MKYKLALDKNNKSEPQIFETLQGEGTFSETPAIFIRLQGCKVGCYFCDEKETWLAKLAQVEGVNYIELSTLEILEEVSKLSELDTSNSENKIQNALKPLNHIVITGGEPTEQDLSELIEALIKEGYFVQIETAATGTYSDSLFKDYSHSLQNPWITFSPKAPYSKRGQEDPKIWKTCSEVKFVVSNEESLDYVERVLVTWAKLNPQPVYLMPDWFDLENNEKRILDTTEKYLGLFKAGKQIHKYLQIH